MPWEARGDQRRIFGSWYIQELEREKEICFYLCACVYVCMSICHMCGYQGRPEEGIGSLEMEL